MHLLDAYRWRSISSAYQMPEQPVPAIFLDRDGVVIAEKNYLRDPDQVELYPGVAEKIRAICLLNVPVVLVTNQSGIGRGMFGWPEYEAVHARMLELLEVKDPFAAVYANGYLPSHPGGAWRKPSAGMFLQAATDLNIRCDRSIMVGDKLVDMDAAAAAGVGMLAHVLTGHGEKERLKVADRYPQATLLDSLAGLDVDLVPGTKSSGAPDPRGPWSSHGGVTSSSTRT